MLSTMPFSRAESARVRIAALWMGLLSIGYAALSAIYFYKDVFEHASSSPMVLLEPSGVGFHVAGNIWTFLSFYRIPMSVLAVVMLGASAVGLWRRMPRARLLSLLSLWGVLLPQTLWYTEFLADWNGGEGIPVAMGAALAIVAVPTALLFGRSLLRKFEGQDTLTGWASLTYGRGRLMGSAIALAWLGFAATSFMDHSSRLPSDLAYFGALMAAGLSTVAVFGIIRLRAWALWAGVASALFLALIPLASLWTSYVPNIGWHINETVGTLASEPLQRAVWTLVPMTVIWLFAGPFLKEFVRKLRDC